MARHRVLAALAISTTKGSHVWASVRGHLLALSVALTPLRYGFLAQRRAVLPVPRETFMELASLEKDSEKTVI